MVWYLQPFTNVRVGKARGIAQPTLLHEFYLGVEVASLLHECADCKPEAVGQCEVVDSFRQRDVVAVRFQSADVTALIAPAK